MGQKKDLSGIFSNFVLESKYFIKDRGGHEIPSILFCLFDAGETLALEPVIDEMIREEIPVQILAFGTAWTLIKEKKECIDINKELDWPYDLDTRSWDRFQQVNEEFLSKIRFCACPDIVITGMVSQFQLQICQVFKELDSEILAYYDAFSPLKPGAIQNLFIPLASQILVPSLMVAKSIHKASEHAVVHVVGQPSLDYWLEVNKNDFQHLKKEINLDDSQPIILFIGGYGEEYKAAFSIFAKAANDLKDLQLVISVHPKTNGSYEKHLLKAEKICFIDDSYNITTAQLVTLADIIVTVNSTVGVQAAFLGKPVIYIHTTEMHYTSIAIELKWAEKITNSSAFVEKINEYLNTLHNCGDRFLSGGIPKDAKDIIFSRIAITQNWLKRKSHLSRK